MPSVVADTQSIVWYLTDIGRLSNTAGVELDSALEAGDGVCVSAITLIELVYLVERGRVPRSALVRLEEAIMDDTQGMTVVPVDAEVARALRRISRDVAPDMPDRTIAATALHLELPLVTSDRRIQQTQVETIW